MTAITIGKHLPPHFNPNRWVRNRQPVPYQIEGRTRTALNHLLKWHGKCLFRSPGKLFSVAAAGGAGERPRWRGAGHTSPMTQYLAVIMRMTGNGTEIAGEYFSRCTVTPVGGAALTPLDMYYPGAISLAGDVPAHHGATLFLLPVSANTSYTWLFADHDGGRLVSASIHEIMLAPNTIHGYLQSTVGVLQPIYDSHRDTAYDLANRAWKQQGGTCINICTDTDAEVRTRTSATAVNFVSNAAGTMGPKIDNRWRNRRSKTTVPYVFKAYGKMASGTGLVRVLDSAANVKGTVSINANVNAWYSAGEIALDADEDTYYFDYAGDGTNQIDLYGVSLYELDT